ncbi:uncharacterized protein FSUBG_6143 [Fusarium subglutinans]|uniref:Uncharacterized protein n=1 Tax=Gibberella subglutinans TaxID=42677 RepID=A0A8H5PZ37_GIBSU|nr:uncharacterized protein FSUBG_6143 [Fusarium subglutinans]KAF5606310.1 hypothetical protein FSUBG_6143 [Fusarium subglutinans]
MGITNDAETACNQPLDKFRRPGVNFTLCPGCKKAATQHLIREHAQPCWFSTTGWPKIERSLYLKQEDGSSHSAEFENIVPHKANRGCNGATRNSKTLASASTRTTSAAQAIQASESISNAGDNFMTTVEMHRAKIDEGTQRLIEWNVTILRIYRILIEDEVCDGDVGGLMGILDELFDKRRELVGEMRETEEELDDAYRELFGLGNDVRYPFPGKVWEDLLRSVVPFPVIMGRK